MNAAAALAIFQGLVGLVSQIAPEVAALRADLSETDVAKLDENLAALDAARKVATGTAEADLDAAAAKG